MTGNFPSGAGNVSSTFSTAGRNGVGALPANAVAGDLVVLEVTSQAAANTLTTAPAGWTQLLAGVWTAGNPGSWIFAKILTAADVSAGTVTTVLGTSTAITTLMVRGTGFDANSITNVQLGTQLSGTGATGAGSAGNVGPLHVAGLTPSLTGQALQFFNAVRTTTTPADTWTVATGNQLVSAVASGNSLTNCIASRPSTAAGTAIGSDTAQWSNGGGLSRGQSVMISFPDGGVPANVAPPAGASVGGSTAPTATASASAAVPAASCTASSSAPAVSAGASVTSTTGMSTASCVAPGVAASAIVNVGAGVAVAGAGSLAALGAAAVSAVAAQSVGSVTPPVATVLLPPRPLRDITLAVAALGERLGLAVWPADRACEARPNPARAWLLSAENARYQITVEA